MQKACKYASKTQGLSSFLIGFDCFLANCDPLSKVPLGDLVGLSVSEISDREEISSPHEDSSLIWS